MMTRYLAVVGILASAPALLWADLSVGPKPKPAPAGKTAALVIEINNSALEARLQVPRQFVPGDIKPAAKPGTQRGDAGPMLPTIMTGLALALALSCGGLWLARRRHTALLLAALFVGGAGAAACWADRPMPKLPPPAAGDKVAVEIVDKGDQVKLVINAAQWKSLVDAAEKKKK